MTVSPAMLARVDQESEAVLLRLYRLSPGARAVLARAFGTLIVPGLRADGGILGVAYGRGVLIEAGGERTYYNVIAGPPGHTRPGRQVPRPVLFDTGRAAFLAAPGWVEGENGAIQILDEQA